MRQVSRVVWRQLYRQACVTRPFPRASGLRVDVVPPGFRRQRWLQQRFYSDDTGTYQPSKLTDRSDEEAAKTKKEIEDRKASQPHYELYFTCNKCMTKSGHKISKQGYHHGTVLVNCPGCKNKHLISDHLGIFSDRGVTLEDIMKEKGQMLKKGVLGADGDVEFYEDKPADSGETAQPAKD